MNRMIIGLLSLVLTSATHSETIEEIISQFEDKIATQGDSSVAVFNDTKGNIMIMTTKEDSKSFCLYNDTLPSSVRIERVVNLSTMMITFCK